MKKITISFDKWSHYANEKHCFDRIYFLGLWLPFCIRHNRFAPYYRAGRSNFFGFSYQKITFLGLIILLLSACQNTTEPGSNKNSDSVCPSLRQAFLEPSKYSGYSTFYHDSLFLTFTNGQIKIESKPPKQSDGTFSFTQIEFKVCIPDTCFLYNGFPDSSATWGDNYQMRYRSGYPLLLPEAYQKEPRPPTSILEPKQRKQRCIE